MSPARSEAHPLLTVLLRAAEGIFPAVDGQVDFLPGLPGGLRHVVSFTGHAARCRSGPISTTTHGSGTPACCGATSASSATSAAW